MTLREIFQKAVGDALRKHKGNRVRAAEELGVSVRSMRNWINNTNKGFSFGKVPPMRRGTPKR